MIEVLIGMTGLIAMAGLIGFFIGRFTQTSGSDQSLFRGVFKLFSDNTINVINCRPDELPKLILKDNEQLQMSELSGQ